MNNNTKLYVVSRNYRGKAVRGIEAHDERLRDQYEANPDIDPERTEQNYHLITPTEPYMDSIERVLHVYQIKPRSTSIFLFEAVISATPEWICALALEEQRTYFSHALSFFTNYFGERNVLSAVVHMDEKTPHMHICIMPITLDHRLCISDLLPYKTYGNFQRELYLHMCSRYPFLAPFIPAKESHRFHHDPKNFKKAPEVYRACDRCIDYVYQLDRIQDPKLIEEIRNEAGQTILKEYISRNCQESLERKIFEKYVDLVENKAVGYIEENKMLKDTIENTRGIVNEKEKENLQQAVTIEDLKDEKWLCQVEIGLWKEQCEALIEKVNALNQDNETLNNQLSDAKRECAVHQRVLDSYKDVIDEERERRREAYNKEHSHSFPLSSLSWGNIRYLMRVQNKYDRTYQPSISYHRDEREGPSLSR